MLIWQATKITLQTINLESNREAAVNSHKFGGPQRTTSLKESKYYIIFVDDFTRMCWIYFLKSKSKVASLFWIFKQWIKKQSGCMIQALRSDNGKEYTSA